MTIFCLKLISMFCIQVSYFILCIKKAVFAVEGKAIDTVSLYRRMSLSLLFALANAAGGFGRRRVPNPKRHPKKVIEVIEVQASPWWAPRSASPLQDGFQEFNQNKGLVNY